MTISSATNKVSYSGNGSTTVFAYAFPITTDADLKVYIRVTATGAETLKTLSTHYTVSGAGGSSGGNVTFTSGNTPASGQTIVVLRDIPATQSLDLVENDSFSAESLEDSLDRLTMITSDVEEELARTIKLSRTNTMTSTEFTTSAASRASKVLSFDSSGELAVSQELGEFQGNWAASTAYVLRDLIKDNSSGKNNIWICITAHTSSGSLPIDTNTDAAKWDLIVDAASATASAAAAVVSAQLADDYAVKVDGAVTGSDYSSKAWSVGGTGVTTTGSRGSSKEWATTTGAAVDTSEYSAKEYALGTTVAAGSAKDWAVLAEDSAVTGSSYSALHHAAKGAASASAASSSASTASTQATNSSNSATASASSATAGASSATAAASSATAAASSATAAASSASSISFTLDDVTALAIALG